MPVAFGAAAIVTVPAFWGGAADLIARHEFALVIWALVVLGAVAGVLPRVRPALSARWLVAGFVALLALTTLSLLWTESLERTVEEVARLTGYGGVLALGLLTIDRRSWQSAVLGLTFAAVAICALAMLARLSLFELPDIASEIGGGRLSYPFEYWNALAAWAAMAGAITLSWAANTRHDIRRSAALAATPMIGAVLYLTFSRGGLVSAAIGIAAVVVLSRNRRRALAQAAIAVTLSVALAAVISGQPEIDNGTGSAGAGWVLLALIAATAAAFFAARLTARLRGAAIRRSGRERSVRTLVAAVALFAVLAPVAYVVVEPGDEVAAPYGATSARFVTFDGSRSLYWGEALEAAAERPVQGVGAGTYEFSWSRSGAAPETVRDAHSLYLEMAAELGLPGLLAILALVVGALWLAAVPLRQGQVTPEAVAMPAAVAVFASFAAVDWLWESTAVTVLALACAVSAGGAGARRIRKGASAKGTKPEGTKPEWAMPKGTTAADGRQGSARGPQPTFRRSPGALAIFGVAFVAMAVQVPGLVSAERTRGAESARVAGLYELARARIDDGISAAPWAASPREELALIEASSGDPGAAVLAQVEAVRREPVAYRRWLILAEMFEDVSARRGALLALGMSRALAPGAAAFSGPYGEGLQDRILALPK